MGTVVKDTRFECSECGEWYEVEVEAVECCPSESTEFEVYICSECSTEYRGESEATACCCEEANE